MKFTYLLSLALLACGCSVAELDESTTEPTKNQCSAESGCGDGECLLGKCRAKQGAFGVVLFEVTPPADAPQALADVHFLKRMSLDVRGGTQDLVLDHVAQVKGTISLKNAPDQTCAPGAPLRVTFRPTESLLGLPTTTYSAKTAPSAPALATESEQAFELNLPAGGYDVYVEDTAPSPACALAPKLFRSIEIQAGIVKLPLPLGPPSVLDLTVIFPVNSQGRTLDGWSIDMVHPDTGDVTTISTVKVLSDPEPVRDLLGRIVDWAYPAKLYYSEANGVPGRELIRLRPPDAPDATPAPTIELQRGGLELWTKGKATIELGPLPDAIDFSGTVYQKERSIGVPGSVWLIGNEFDPPLPTLASFRQIVEAGADGKFSAKLLPGSYRVHAVPAPGSGFAATETMLEIGKKPAIQEGKVIELAKAGIIDGSLVGPNGYVSGASVHAMAAPAAIKVSAFQSAVGEEPFVPRASGCSGRTASCVPLTDESGRFSIEADPGTFDVSIRPQPDSGFAWLVRPNVVVGDVGQPQMSQLGSLELPLPVVYTGKVTDVDGRVVPGALIKAYIYTQDATYTEDVTDASVLQVAETRAIGDGTFELLLPARLMKPF